MKRLPVAAVAALLPCLSPRGQDEPVTFAEHVAPIIFDNCTSCHRPGEVAPFPFMNFRDVRKRARMIARVTRKRIMPPWLPVDGLVPLADTRRLSDEEIDTIARWVAGGMPEGDPALTPPLPEFVEGWQLGEPDLVVQMAEPFEVPADGPDIYRNFVIPLDLDEDKWVTAMEVRPGKGGVLHHTVTGLDETHSMRALDGKDGMPGSRGASVGTGRNIGGWAVGATPRHLPLGLAYRVKQADDLILFSHLCPTGKPELEQTKIGLHFTDQRPPRAMINLALPPQFGIGLDLTVAPGESDFVVTDRFVLPADALLLSIDGHAHLICREIEVFVTPPDGEKRKIFWIDDWDFSWQGSYPLAEPMELASGTAVEVRLVYDNSADNPDNPHDPPVRVNWGINSTDEMASVLLVLLPNQREDAPPIRAAIRYHEVLHMEKARYRRTALLESVDANGDGRVDFDTELPDTMYWAKPWDVNRDGGVDPSDLATLKKLRKHNKRLLPDAVIERALAAEK